MLSFIKGTIEYIYQDCFVIENEGLGYKIYTSLEVLGKLVLRENVKVFTYMSVREDDISLFGFLRQDELEVFKLLISVNGIGPKGALAILSVLSVDDLRMAVLSEDFKAIAKANGVGPKTAQRVVIELKDKFKLEDVLPSLVDSSDVAFVSSDASKEAILALTSLGYSNMEATKAVKSVGDISSLSVEEIIKLALKSMVVM